MILSAHTVRQLRNASLSALYRVAYEHDVDLSDILALITPSRQIPQAPAARTYPPVPVAVQAEEVSQAASSADLSPSPTVCAEAIPESRTPALAVRAQGRSDVDASSECLSTSLPGAEGVVDRAHHPQSAVDADLEEQEKAIIAETGKSVGEQSPAAPVKRTRAPRTGISIKQQVDDLHREHPDWDAKRIAEQIGAKFNTVMTALADARAKAGTSPIEPVPEPNPQKPVGPPPPANLMTLKERIRARHRQHPQWTARMIANDLGANPGSVSAILATVRKEEAGQAVEVQPEPPPAPTLPNQPAGSIETRLKADAAARKKRLGARP